MTRRLVILFLYFLKGLFQTSDVLLPDVDVALEDAMMDGHLVEVIIDLSFFHDEEFSLFVFVEVEAVGLGASDISKGIL